MKILIVEDDPHTQKVFQSILTHEGHAVFFSPSGKAGLLSAKQSVPDLILLDIPFSDSDGFLFLQKLRSAPETVSVPVIILLNKSHADLMDKYLHIGASACLEKPFRPWQLFAQIEALRL